ncbi:helix-turn-helix domain-containing protein [Pseudomonas mosselii]|uniref:helix-turn-helix domain-containing protein n=1 Tax=Pseudomonas mosselii TaxID=78327 RepID=UPI003F3E8B9B
MNDTQLATAHSHTNKYIDLYGSTQTRHTLPFYGAEQMALREAFAAVLQLLREQRKMSQHEVAGAVTQSHISQLEAAKTSATIETAIELAKALRIEPLSLLALLMAADTQRTVRQALEQAMQELEEAKLLDVLLPSTPTSKPHPRVEKAAEAREQVQALKSLGKTQGEIIELLGLPRSTVSRHWNRED